MFALCSFPVVQNGVSFFIYFIAAADFRGVSSARCGRRAEGKLFCAGAPGGNARPALAHAPAAANIAKPLRLSLVRSAVRFAREKAVSGDGGLNFTPVNKNKGIPAQKIQLSAKKRAFASGGSPTARFL